jgi:flagellar biosynthesis chaperone FliJ
MNKDKLITAVKLEEAIKQGRGSFILLEKIDELEKQIEEIPPTDLSEVENRLENIENKLEEDLIIELEII